MVEELCGVCGEPYYRHMLSGGLRTCPFTAFSYRPARSRTITKEQVEEALAAMLVAMVEHGIPPDLQEALTYGDGRGTLAPGALRKAALAAAKAFGLVVED